jgi:hypothetical protein
MNMIYGHIKIEFILNATKGIKNPSFLIPFVIIGMTPVHSEFII